MTEELSDIDLSTWFPTYGMLTSQRILERFGIHLSNEELSSATKDPESLYFQLLRIPLKNLFNGIILQQADDYQVYAQKLFIDYLLSGEAGKDPTSQGANTREDLEFMRTEVMRIGEDFSHQELAHEALIYESQASLIKVSTDKKTLKSRRGEVDVIVSAYLERADDMRINLCSYRSQFYDAILRSTELLQLLPDYKVDKVQEIENRESLYFDAHLGGY